MDNTEIVFQIHTLERRISRLNKYLYEKIDEIVTIYEKSDSSKEDVINNIISFESFFTIQHFDEYLTRLGDKTQENIITNDRTDQQSEIGSQRVPK